jgi:leader peptidase (prepilin peptidase)/N-methyltransferase
VPAGGTLTVDFRPRLGNMEAVLAAIFVLGTILGSLANWAVYRLAWHQRTISPWGPKPEEAKPRSAMDRVPIVGWLGLARESNIHGRGFWIRPMLLELSMGLGLAALCWWEVFQRGLIVNQISDLAEFVIGALITVKPVDVPLAAVWPTFITHIVLVCLMVAGSFIDIDEKLIPDEITVPGTILGLVLATLIPLGLLPMVSYRDKPAQVGTPIVMPRLGQQPLMAEPVTLVAPLPWPTELEGAPKLQSLAIGLGCWWLWCFALAPRFLRGRKSLWRKLQIVTRRVARELTRGLLGWITGIGTLAVAGVWWWGGAPWIGLLTSLVGLAGGGAIVWIVRLVGTAALKREAMGFGDVTFMMMVGTYLGWQACVIIFFISPLAAVMVGVLQAVLKSDDELPYVPYLALGTLFVMVAWAAVWNRVEFAFQLGWLMPAVLVVCFTLLGVLLFIWQQIKTRLLGFGREE